MIKGDNNTGLCKSTQAIIKKTPN